MLFLILSSMKKSIHLPDTVTVLIQGKNLKPWEKLKFYKRNIPITYAGEIIAYLAKINK